MPRLPSSPSKMPRLLSASPIPVTPVHASVHCIHCMQRAIEGRCRAWSHTICLQPSQEVLQWCRLGFARSYASCSCYRPGGRVVSLAACKVRLPGRPSAIAAARSCRCGIQASKGIYNNSSVRTDGRVRMDSHVCRSDLSNSDAADSQHSEQAL